MVALIVIIIINLLIEGKKRKLAHSANNERCETHVMGFVKTIDERKEVVRAVVGHC